jgi:mono/diheme cytochrome c family protein
MKEEVNLPKDSQESLAFYTGEPGGEEKNPDRMFRRGVRCQACHRDEDPRTVSGQSCTSCHGKGFGRLLDTQKKTYRSWVANLARGWDLYGEALGEQWSQGQSKAFEDRLALLSRGGWVHNIPVARDFVVGLERKLTKATGGAFTPLLAPAWEVSRTDRACFWRCHLDIPFRKTAGARPLEIPHRRHLEKAGLRCRRCHREDRRETAPEKHGRLRVTRTDCLRCHHIENTQRDDCRTCHREQTAIMEGEGVPRAGVLRRTNCPKVQCRDCHPLVSGTHRREDVLATCVGCHGRSREVTLKGWARAVDKRLDSVNLKLRALRPRLEGREEEAASAFFALAQKQVRWVEKDGSRGAHNVHYTLRVLDKALENAAEAEALLGK